MSSVFHTTARKFSNPAMLERTYFSGNKVEGRGRLEAQLRDGAQ
ncbi:MAG TPA: hypothetical protein VGC64_03575 [Pyrinomonadaceae bacterium]